MFIFCPNKIEPIYWANTTMTFIKPEGKFTNFIATLYAQKVKQIYRDFETTTI